MSRCFLFVPLAAALLVSAAVAADAIKIDLKDFKLKPAAEGGDTLVGYNDADAKLFFYVNATATTDVKVPADGEYTLTVEASCDEANNVKAKVAVKIGDEVVTKSFELKETTAKEYTFPVKLKKGDKPLVIEYLNDEFKEGEYDRNLYLHAVKLEPKKK